MRTRVAGKRAAALAGLAALGAVVILARAYRDDLAFRDRAPPSFVEPHRMAGSAL